MQQMKFSEHSINDYTYDIKKELKAIENSDFLHIPPPYYLRARETYNSNKTSTLSYLNYSKKVHRIQKDWYRVPEHLIPQPNNYPDTNRGEIFFDTYTHSYK